MLLVCIRQSARATAVRVIYRVHHPVYSIWYVQNIIVWKTSFSCMLVNLIRYLIKWRREHKEPTFRSTNSMCRPNIWIQTILYFIVWLFYSHSSLLLNLLRKKDMWNYIKKTIPKLFLFHLNNAQKITSSKLSEH